MLTLWHCVKVKQRYHSTIIYFFSKFSLISRINSRALLSGTYEKLVELLDNYNPNVKIADEPIAVEVQEQREFLDELFNTDIIRETYSFLKMHGYVNSRQDFRNTFEKMWFEPYDRDGNSRTDVLGSR